CDWRDCGECEFDLPPLAFVPDHSLLALAPRPPRDRGALENIRGLPQQTLHRRGAELVGEIAAGLSEDPPPAPPRPPKRDSHEAPLVSLAQALLRQRSSDSGVATELIATQAELAALVGAVRRDSGADDVRALAGWRRELVGAELVELIEGRLAVSVQSGGGLRVAPLAP
ncbi:MAG: HRDC domain-containing protein, partial [Thermoleophilaceae bacterium]